jgi:DNA-binding transcriptional LysR family regulator
VKRAVEIGAGVSIVPRQTVEQEVRAKTLAAVEFIGQPYYRPLGMIYKSGRVLSPAMKRFLNVLKEPLEGPSVPAVANGAAV